MTLSTRLRVKFVDRKVYFWEYIVMVAISVVCRFLAWHGVGWLICFLCGCIVEKEISTTCWHRSGQVKYNPQGIHMEPLSRSDVTSTLTIILCKHEIHKSYTRYLRNSYFDLWFKIDITDLWACPLSIILVILWKVFVK